MLKEILVQSLALGRDCRVGPRQPRRATKASGKCCSGLRVSKVDLGTDGHYSWIFSLAISILFLQPFSKWNICIGGRPLEKTISRRTTVRKTVEVEDKLLSMSRYKIHKNTIVPRLRKGPSSRWRSKAVETY